MLGEYIDDNYNTTRRHSFIDYECPITFELKGRARLGASTQPMTRGGSFCTMGPET